MAGRIRFVCLLHSHQPVGNFDHVVEEAYKMSYLPYMEVFEQFPEIPLTNHYSGCLLEWLEKRHPDYIDRLVRNCEAIALPAEQNETPRSRWEMIGGGYYEPIMTMLPERDRLGQIAHMVAYLAKRFGARPRGLWLPERVWEPGLVKDLADAGAKYLTLDDSHFKAAGLEDAELVGGFITEDQGRILRVYPASEQLRYLIPFAAVSECLKYLRSLLPEDGERVVCYADDGEKFGVWPKTHQHVYLHGWLKEFLAALQSAQKEGWLICSTLGDAYDEVEAVGRIFLPENSYREMTEWALPTTRLVAYEAAIKHIKHYSALSQDPAIKQIISLVKGGNWRYFKVKYLEGNNMYSKMMEVSAKVAKLPKKAALIDKARTHLYRGQCNCPYWHGVFGGMYLPHLRSAVYSELIKADKLADEITVAPTVGKVVQDFDFDGEKEVKLFNTHTALYLHPQRGGHLYEFDLRDINFNVGDTFSRRLEAYHDKVAHATIRSEDETASIHDLILAKQPGLTQLLKYDTYQRESLVDHLSPTLLTPEDMLSGDPPSDPGFRQDAYDLRVFTRRDDSRGGDSRIAPTIAGDSCRGGSRTAPPMTAPAVIAELVRSDKWRDAEVRVTKRIILRQHNSFEIEYVIEHCGGAAIDGFFGVEMNYSLLAGDAHDRYYFYADKANAGKLMTVADFGAQMYVGLKDEYLNVALILRTFEPARVVVSPVRTVSQSEGGFEAIYQSSSVVLQWPLKLSSSGKDGAAEVFAVKLLQEIERVRD
ncbi:MAG: alpha-amylase/4-alpha-glucanotransferase domain-containing protein [Planctomycetota bacterium]